MTKLSNHGSVLGASLLIAGCCIGAGMLGLPVLTGMAGFQPALVLLGLSWLFMATTGLLLLEVNLWFRDEVSIVSMAERTLGKPGKWISWGTYLFLFYTVLVACMTEGGSLFSGFTQAVTDLSLPNWVGSLGFTLLFGLLIYLGTGVVDRFNRLLMGGLIGAYVLLMLLGAPHIHVDHLKHHNWHAALFIVPPMVFSFGYHNLVPSLTTYLGHQRHRLVTSILAGSLIALMVYILWEWLILGMSPVDGDQGLRAAMQGGISATHVLKNVVGFAWVVTVGEFFALFAIVTTFLSVALSFVDFLADGLAIEKTAKGRAFLCLLTLAPPFTVAMLYPHIFLVALNYAGAFGAAVLFGILPALMVWSGRYRNGLQNQQIVPGGRFVLLLVILFASLVIGLQLVRELGLTPEVL